MKKRRWPVWLALSGQVSISAGTYVVAKVALATFGGPEVLLLRFVATLPMFVALLFALPRPRLPARADAWAMIVLGVLGLPLNQGFFLKGLERTTPSHAALLYALSPMLVFVLAALARHERATAAKLAGIATALAGVVVVLLERGLAQEAGTLQGDALIFVGVVAWVLYSVHGRPLAAQYGGVRVTCWTAIAGSVLCLPFAPLVVSTEHLARAGVGAWLAVAFLCVLTSFVSYLLWYFALERIEASRAAVWSNLTPVVTAALSFLAWRTPVTAGFAVGGAAVIVGVLLTQRE